MCPENIKDCMSGLFRLIGCHTSCFFILINKMYFCSPLKILMFWRCFDKREKSLVKSQLCLCEILVKLDLMGHEKIWT